MNALGGLVTHLIPDIIGENAFFVNQSGTFSKKFSDYSKEDSTDMSDRNADMVEQGLSHDLNVPVTKESETMWQLLGGLGSHDLSLMREALGMPQSVLGASLDMKNMFWKCVR